MKSTIFFLVVAFASSNLFAQEKPLPAQQVVDLALQQARKENKKVMVIFHASWCGWCHKMDTALNDKSCKKFFDENFVITHLVIDEYGENKSLENPGVYAFRTKYRGEGLGIPYWLIFDKDGNLLADSQIRPEGAGFDTPGQNAGCPAAAEEVAYFISLLKKTTNLDAQQLKIIEQRFRKNAN